MGVIKVGANGETDGVSREMPASRPWVSLDYTSMRGKGLEGVALATAQKKKKIIYTHNGIAAVWL